MTDPSRIDELRRVQPRDVIPIPEVVQPVGDILLKVAWTFVGVDLLAVQAAHGAGCRSGGGEATSRGVDYLFADDVQRHHGRESSIPMVMYSCGDPVKGASRKSTNEMDSARPRIGNVVVNGRKTEARLALKVMMRVSSRWQRYVLRQQSRMKKEFSESDMKNGGKRVYVSATLLDTPNLPRSYQLAARGLCDPTLAHLC
ncbi:hypothetical protein FPV67DRAFT_1447948 [Lyophyllum atratum]|nr:hypothetical protein FPV67DRAFT_1447948 [Lyophyllum atratum]